MYNGWRWFKLYFMGSYVSRVFSVYTWHFQNRTKKKKLYILCEICEANEEREPYSSQLKLRGVVWVHNLVSFENLNPWSSLILTLLIQKSTSHQIFKDNIRI